MSTRTLFAIIFLVLLLALAVSFWTSPGPELGEQGRMPWHIQVHPDGASTVFGVRLGAATLQQAAEALGKDYELAIVAGPGEVGSLEAFYSSVHLGGLSAKIILGLEADKQALRDMRQGAADVGRMDSGALKFTLSRADAARAQQARVHTITYIPRVNLDADIVTRRFGRPEERVQTSPEVEHWLYRQQGLDLILNGDGKEILQYVPPADFHRLREPLRTSGGKDDS